MHSVKCFQILQFNTNNSIKHQSFVYIQFSDQTVLFQTIQFSTSMQFSSIWCIDRTLSGATTLCQSGPGSDGNEEVLCIPQSSSITEASPSDWWVSYPRHSMGESDPSAKMQSAFCIPSWLDQVRGSYLFQGY